MSSSVSDNQQPEYSSEPYRDEGIHVQQFPGHGAVQGYEQPWYNTQQQPYAETNLFPFGFGLGIPLFPPYPPFFGPFVGPFFGPFGGPFGGPFRGPF